MPFGLDLVEGRGWILTGDDEVEIKCLVCKIDLTADYYFCPERKEFFCRQCELQSKHCHGYGEIDHMHYHILQHKTAVAK